MAFKSFTDRSKETWGSSNETCSIKEIQLGAILRIASAVEVMARRYNDLIEERDRSVRLMKIMEGSWERERRSNAALRGQITKLKKRKID